MKTIAVVMFGGLLAAILMELAWLGLALLTVPLPSPTQFLGGCLLMGTLGAVGGGFITGMWWTERQ